MLLHQPPELVHAIIRCVDDRKTLQSLRLVSRILHFEVDPFLYGTVFLCDGVNHSLEGQVQGLCERIRAPGSHIAPHVKHLTIRPYSSSSVYMKPDVLESLAQVLGQLCNLLSFSFECRTACFTQSSCPIFRILADIRMPASLRHLLWDHYDFGIEAMSVVLHQQDNLERLDLPWLQGRLDMSPVTLSRLRILSCTVDLALSILPGRKITHLKALKLKDGLDVPEADGYLRIRVFSGMGSWASAFTLASQMPALECLELSIHYISEPWFLVLSRLIPRLKSTQLRYVHITGCHSFSTTDTDSDVVKDCFSQLSTLQWIQVRNVGGSTYRIFDRWTREAPDAPKTIAFDREWDWVDGWEYGCRMADRVSERRWC